MAGEIDQVAGGSQHVFAAAYDLLADLRQSDVAGPPLDQFDAEPLLEIANLHGQGRLGDRAGFRCPSEMPVLGQGIEIAKLPQRDHIDKIILSTMSGNTIRPDL